MNEFDPIGDLDAEIMYEEKHQAKPVKPKKKKKENDNKTKGKKSSKREAMLAWSGAQRVRCVDNFMLQLANDTRKSLGHSSVLIGDDFENMIVGIPMYSGNDSEAYKYPGCLPLEFVMAQDVFPLSLIVQLVAMAGVGKSALLAEFCRWFRLAGGGFTVFENETKFNPTWYSSILGEDVLKNNPTVKCQSLENWQTSLSEVTRLYKMRCIGTKDAPGPGRTLPLICGIDSIMGKSSETTQEKILGKRLEKDDLRGTTGTGFAGRGFPIEALSLSRYLKTYTSELDNWPMSLVLVNHLRRNKTEDGIEERQKSGGKAVDFSESFELELIKYQGHKRFIQCANWEGYPIKISCEKNSFGPTHRSILTRLLWWHVEDEDGRPIQKTIWDWDWSTVHLLNSILSGDNKGSGRLKKRLSSVFKLTCPSTSDVENRAWSETLGMKASDAVPWSELGAMIRQDQDLMVKLRHALLITERKRFSYTDDFVDQISGDRDED